MQALLNKPIKAEAQAVKPGKEHRYSLQNLRGLSIIFVMLTHITSFNALGSFGNFLVFLFGDATSWFVFISGYFFDYIERNRFDYFDYLKKKARFVILPYFILSVPAILAGIAFKRHLVMGLEPLGYVFWSLLVGGSVIVPMWFIPMIVVFFVLTPIFHWLGRSAARYIVVPITLIITLFTFRPVENFNPFLAFVHFAGFYGLGVIVSSNYKKIAIYSQTRAADLAVVGGVLIFLMASFIDISGLESQPIGFMDGLGHFNDRQFGKLGLLLAVFLLFERFLNVPNRFLGWMADISFGLFFLHGFFMAAYAKAFQPDVFSSPLLRLVVELGLVLGGSVVAVIVAKAVLGKWSRYVIGC